MAKKGTAYKPTDADREFVERAVMAGSRIEDIAAALNLHDDTLRKHYRYEIMTGRERLKGHAVRVLNDSLTDGSLDAAKFVLSRVAGWTEKQDIGISGSVETKTTIDPSKLPTEAMEALLAARRNKPDE